jgi:hypothetical protein
MAASVFNKFEPKDIRISAQRFGEWSKVQAIIDSLPREINNALSEHLTAMGREGVSVIQGHIDNSDLGWKPLSPVTIERKMEAGNARPSAPWLATGETRNAIKYWKRNNVLSIGIPKGTMGEDARDLGRDAVENEYGVLSSAKGGYKIPARPLFAPSFVQLLAWQRKRRNYPSQILVRNIARKYQVQLAQ